MKLQMIAGLAASFAVVAMTTAAEISTVEAAIPAPITALGTPRAIEFPGGISMAVTATTESAQAHVNQGLNHLHGGWETEASRHFAAAMREDPECLLAHWGMVMTLLAPSPETDSAQLAAIDRLLDLVDRGKGSELERGYAYGLAKYLDEGPASAANAFRKVANQFPNDLQAGLFTALFGRTGYDTFGSAMPEQEAAELSLLALIEKHPQSPLPLNALLSIRAEAHKLGTSVVLARRLCEMVPDYAPYAHLLGHYEWRTGQHGAANASFTRASSLYETWMKENNATVADCPEWVKSECYRIVSLVSKGDFNTAFADARKLTSSAVPQGREKSPGARQLLWEAETLAPRIVFYQSQKGTAAEVLKTMIQPQVVKGTLKNSLAYWWIDGLRLGLEAQRLIDERKLSDARDVMTAITAHGEGMAKTQAEAIKNGERSAWIRSFRAFEVLASSLRGNLALTGPPDKIGTAYNWFASAADRQAPASLMFPPMILTPMATRLGDFYIASKKPTEAIESYQRALTSSPNDLKALLGLQNAYLEAKLPEDAAATGAQIDALRAP